LPTSTVTVNSRKYDGSIRRTWSAEASRIAPPLIELIGIFEFDVDHPELGHIRKGTVSHETYWLDRWYNIFRFEEPRGEFRNYYVNLIEPPRFDSSVLDYVDLDIDIVVWPDGRFDVLDIEDFQVNSQIYKYPADLIANVESELKKIIEIVESGDLSRLYS
jgi:protein associated with RNAse G/E